MRFGSVILALTLACGVALANDSLNIKKTAALNDSELLLPANYRNWVALAPNVPGMPPHHHNHLVSKVYVEPSSYEQFLQSKKWPDHTVIVLELRDKMTAPKTLCDGMIGLEVAAKDDSRLPDPWNYYGIIYDHQTQARPDHRLAMYFPALRAVIDGDPQTMQPSAF
ncbi:MAG TPA: cytochrome P460 family protein [Terriglobales bacterium]|nr:cytochrome P460 family protein [Terriglobales bacterium]